MKAIVRITRNDGPKMLLDVSKIPQAIVAEVLEPEARLHAQELAKFTFPIKVAEGRQRLEHSIRSIFKSTTGPDAQSIRSQPIKDALARIKDPNKAAALLKDVLGGGKDMVIENASRGALVPLRDYRGKARSHPRSSIRRLSTEASIKRTIRDVNKDVGGAKKGWVIPGAKVPGWVKSANGPVGTHTVTRSPGLTQISVENPTRAMADIESREALSEFVVKLRSIKIIKKINFLVRYRLNNPV